MLIYSPTDENIDSQEGEKATNKGSVAFRSISLVRLGCLNIKTRVVKIPRQREHATYPSIALLIIRLWRCTRASLYLFPFLSFPYIFLLFPLSVSPPPPKGQDTFDATNNKFECVNLGNWYATGKNFNDRVVNNKINWIIL